MRFSVRRLPVVKRHWVTWGGSTLGVQEGLLVLVVPWRKGWRCTSLVLSRLLLALWLPPLLRFSLLLLGLSMTPILMSILLGLLGKLSLSLALPVGLLIAGLLLTTLQLLSGLDSTGTAGSVAPCAAGERKACTSRKRSDRPFTERERERERVKKRERERERESEKERERE